MNFIGRFKSLPVSTKRLLSIGVLLAFVAALPLFVWGIIFGNFNIYKKAASGEATPSPTPISVYPPAGECQFCGGIGGILCQSGLSCQSSYGSILYPDGSGICLKPTGGSICNAPLPTPPTFYCLKHPPTLVIMEPIQYGSPSATLTYTATATNNDEFVLPGTPGATVCQPTGNRLVGHVPTGWTSTFNFLLTAPYPQQSRSVPFTVKSSASAAQGLNQFTVDLTTQSGTFLASASAQYYVITPVQTPEPTPIGNTINWNTSHANLSATNFYLNIEGKGVYQSNSAVVLHSDPGNSTYTTLESTWQEKGVEMRLFMYFSRDPSTNRWRVTEMRTYDGNPSGNWLFYPGFEGTDAGSMLNIGNANYTSYDGKGHIHFENMVLRPIFSSQTGETQTFTINVKLAGVAAGAANGAQVRVRFRSPSAGGGEFDYTTSPVTLTYIGNGTYQAALLFGTSVPLLPGASDYVVYIKGEKHLARKFCQATGQTYICTGGGHININGVHDDQTFDFVGLPLEPGDLYPQDGSATLIGANSDLGKIQALLAKSPLTEQDIYIGDLDYDNAVTIRDLFLLKQTLSTRYDDN